MSRPSSPVCWTIERNWTRWNAGKTVGEIKVRAAPGDFWQVNEKFVPKIFRRRSHLALRFNRTNQSGW